MAARARILWDGVYGYTGGLEIGTQVVLTNDDLGGETSKRWTLSKRPAGSSALLADLGGGAMGLTPDVYGTYEVRLVVNNALLDIGHGAALYPSQDREPSVGEGSGLDPVSGWGLSAKSLWRDVGLGLGGLGGVVEVSASSTLTKAQVVGKLLLAESGGGALVLEMPDLDETWFDGASGMVVREGANTVSLDAPAGAGFVWAGGSGSSYVLSLNHSAVRWRYKQDTNTFYLFRHGASGEDTNMESVGAGASVYKEKHGSSLFRLRSLIGGLGVSAQQNADDITLRAGIRTVQTISTSSNFVAGTHTDGVLNILTANSGAITCALPEMTADHDLHTFAVSRDGQYNVRLTTHDGTYALRYAGFLSDQYVDLTGNGETILLIYRHSTKTFYVVGSAYKEGADYDYSPASVIAYFKLNEASAVPAVDIKNGYNFPGNVGFPMTPVSGPWDGVEGHGFANASTSQTTAAFRLDGDITVFADFMGTGSTHISCYTDALTTDPLWGVGVGPSTTLWSIFDKASTTTVTRVFALPYRSLSYGFSAYPVCFVRRSNVWELWIGGVLQATLTGFTNPRAILGTETLHLLTSSNSAIAKIMIANEAMSAEEIAYQFRRRQGR